MTWIPRSQSGLRGPTDGMFVTPDEKWQFVVHWDGGRNPVDAADELVLLRAYIQHHFNQGWQGPAYNLGVGPITGDVYELRGLGAVGTHAPGANRDGIGCILIGGPGNLTELGKRGLQEAYAIASNFAGRKLTQRVHYDVVSTSCPGPDLAAWVHGGGLDGGTIPAPTPTTEDEGDIMRLLYTRDQGGVGQLWTLTNAATGEIIQTRDQELANTWAAAWGNARNTDPKGGVQGLLNALEALRGTTAPGKAAAARLEAAIADLRNELTPA